MRDLPGEGPLPVRRPEGAVALTSGGVQCEAVANGVVRPANTIRGTGTHTVPTPVPLQGGEQAIHAVLMTHMSRTSRIHFDRRHFRHATKRPAEDVGQAGSSRRSGRGQTLVEFTLVFPFFLILLFSVIEFSFALNAVLSVDFATREAALAASEAGTQTNADCSILRAIERSVQSPADSDRLTQVRIFKATANGVPASPLREIVYTRGGSGLSCPLSDGTPATLPYSYASGTYTSDTRCDTLAGCGGGSVSVDTIGVEATYDYRWHTPLPTLLPTSGTGYVVTQGNAMRMEPVQ
jgi:TadE-like protein